MNRAVRFLEITWQRTHSPFIHMQAVSQVILERNLVQAEVQRE